MPKAKSKDKQYKVFPVIHQKVLDSAKGIVEELVSVFGVIDLGNDIVHPGAFRKTITERAGHIRVLDQHNSNSIFDVLGKPLQIREVGRTQLPEQVLEKYPEATGGLLVETQYNLNTFAGKEAFERIVAGDINEYSFAYDALDFDFSTEKAADGTEVVVRNLRTLKLYEYSPVIWGMNPATAVVGAKGDKDRADASNYRPIEDNAQAQRCGTCRFYREVTEQRGYCKRYDFVAEQNYLCDAYAASKAASSKEMTGQGPMQRVGDFLIGAVFQTMSHWLGQMLTDGFLSTEEHLQLAELSLDIVKQLGEDIPEDVRLRPLRHGGMGMLLMSAAGALVSRAVKLFSGDKAGRVLSARSLGKITAAIARVQEGMTELESLMRDAGAYDDEEEEDDETMTGEQAGPSDDQTPTSAETEARLRQELASLELDILSSEVSNANNSRNGRGEARAS